MVSSASSSHESRTRRVETAQSRSPEPQPAHRPWSGDLSSFCVSSGFRHPTFTFELVECPSLPPRHHHDRHSRNRRQRDRYRGRQRAIRRLNLGADRGHVRGAGSGDPVRREGADLGGARSQHVSGSVLRRDCPGRRGREAQVTLHCNGNHEADGSGSWRRRR